MYIYSHVCVLHFGHYRCPRVRYPCRCQCFIDNTCSDITCKILKGFPRLSIIGNQQDLEIYDSHKQ